MRSVARHHPFIIFLPQSFGICIYTHNHRHLEKRERRDRTLRLSNRQCAHCVADPETAGGRVHVASQRRLVGREVVKTGAAARELEEADKTTTVVEE